MGYYNLAGKLLNAAEHTLVHIQQNLDTNTSVSKWHRLPSRAVCVSQIRPPKAHSTKWQQCKASNTKSTYGFAIKLLV
jgi:hypothetical protein